MLLSRYTADDFFVRSLISAANLVSLAANDKR